MKRTRKGWVIVLVSVVLIAGLFAAVAERKDKRMAKGQTANLSTASGERENELLVELTTVAHFNQGKVFFSGETNLPTGTRLMITLSGADEKILARDRVQVQNGKFSAAVFSVAPTEVVGECELAIRSLSIQPVVQNIIGRHGGHLAGPLVKYDPQRDEYAVDYKQKLDDVAKQN